MPTWSPKSTLTVSILILRSTNIGRTVLIFLFLAKWRARSGTGLETEVWSFPVRLIEELRIAVLIHNSVFSWGLSFHNSLDEFQWPGSVPLCPIHHSSEERKSFFVCFFNILLYWNNCIVKYISQAGLPHLCLLSSYRGQRSPTGLPKIYSNISIITATVGTFFFDVIQRPRICFMKLIFNFSFYIWIIRCFLIFKIYLK